MLHGPVTPELTPPPAVLRPATADPCSRPSSEISDPPTRQTAHLFLWSVTDASPPPPRPDYAATERKHASLSASARSKLGSGRRTCTRGDQHETATDDALEFRSSSSGCVAASGCTHPHLVYDSRGLEISTAKSPGRPLRLSARPQRRGPSFYDLRTALT
ncbi:hypothetical protein OH76DRAFT_296240 [Lentinus brumalis]|uniref:Uncharacterized protein n=1 Tax=Lentinus brumalis TaxID=2498619 RepID=A0A371DG50_9APHY|nr:hypothetical protein OH76DRAFT_296240 [Polyporus brumalis]